jgi:phage terminase large subunit
LQKILKLRKRLKIIQGGTAAGKTIAILLILIDKAQCEKGKIYSVVSETLPHLKKGAIRDFLSIMEGHKYYKDKDWNRTDFIYTFHTGTKIEFFSADNADKVRGPRRDVLFINECNNISYETYTQLAIRTNEDIYLDYNPVSEFWVHSEILNKTENDFIILTYKDNEELNKAVIQEIESRKNRKGWWDVYGLGQLGEVEGKIYSNWQIIDEIPHEARLERRGMDFGYTNDPTAIVDIYNYNGGFIVDERLFRKGCSNKQLADFINSLEQPELLVVADSAEPKSVDEIAGYGINIIPAVKGQGSVTQGINFVQDQRISVTKRSYNIIKEYRNYLWKVDKDGKVLNIPEEGWDHSMDAIRYALAGYQRTDDNFLKELDDIKTDW